MSNSLNNDVSLDDLKKAWQDVADSSGYVPKVTDEEGNTIWEGEMIPFSEPNAYQKCQEITERKIREISERTGEPIQNQTKLTEQEFIEKLKTNGVVSFD